MGDEIRVIAPSMPIQMVEKSIIEKATNRLEELGYRVSFSQGCKLESKNDSEKIQVKVGDIQEAFLDGNVKCILTLIGGYYVNEILEDINYDIISDNPKIICGFSDITALLSAITKMTGLVTYYGPHFTTFAMKELREYNENYFLKAVAKSGDYIIEQSDMWRDNSWFSDENSVNIYKTKSISILNKGYAVGKVIGGNLRTLVKIVNTKYFMDYEESILFLEDDIIFTINFIVEFVQNIQKLMRADNFFNIRGIVIGRCSNECMFEEKLLGKVLLSIEELRSIPIIYGVDFGHTSPICTIPIGGIVSIKADDKVEFKVIEH